MTKKATHEIYPVLPLRDIVVFPHMIVPLFVGRERSVQALENVMAGPDKHIVLVTQKDASLDDPKAPDLYTIGTLGTILQLLKLPDGTVKVLVEGTQRVKVAKYIAENDFFRAEVDILHDTIKDVDRADALARTVTSEFEGYIKLNRKIPPDVLVTINQIDDPTKLADTIASYFSLKISDKQDLLETVNVEKRFEKVLAYIESESHVLQTEKRIRSRVKKQMEKTQRDYYLNEQLKAIYKELGDAEDSRDEISDLEERAKKLKLSKEAQERFKSEIKKLKMMNHSSAEATVVRNYLDWILSLPWNARTKVKKDLDAAEVVLDRDHYGLSKIKERILEYLSVQARVGKMRGQILCLVGPPGVGKTSLGKSIAEATGRNFVRISLGGVRDESEVRGHRRTYIGSMPGKILQGMKKAKSANPLFLLDEIDKLGSDWRGDPASALLEVLDPEQNGTFNDHYLELDYDLSDVMFVTTANTLNMPQPLLDRMEIIRIPGYTEDEKMHIAKEHLIPKQFKIHALKPSELKIDDEALRHLIRRYTREAGVRNLEREIANLSRKAVKSIQKDKKSSCHVTVENINDFSGVEKYFYGQAEKDDLIGVTTGMAWTESGGDLLMIEAVVLPGKGKTMITGKLGDVMQESVQAALSYVRMRSHIFGIHPSVFEKKDIHVHVPEGATPKDGPSAGIAMCTSIISAFTGIPVRRDVAMTGEITLRGRVLPIGGLKEKMLAAHRGGILTVIIPSENEKDLADIPANIKEGLTIIPVQTVDDVLKVALINVPTPINIAEITETDLKSHQTIRDDHATIM